MGKTLSNDEFLQKLKDLDVKYVPLEEYQGLHTAIKWQCDKNPNHTFKTEPCKIYAKKCHCLYCNHREVFIGETDMWTTRPDIASMLVDFNDGYKYFAQGSQKLDWICPNCKSIVGNKRINSVYKYGLSCQNCSDGMSFGEKFVYELLTQLKCKFIYDRKTKWSKNKRYDFYVPAMSLIIEVNGLQHYEKGFQSCRNNQKARTVHEEQKNDKYKKQIALSNNIKHYVSLDCRISDIHYIKNSILNSELNNLFDLSIVNWNECYKATVTSNVIVCANLWNEGMKSTKDIANYTGIHISSVISNLKKATKIGLCDYITNYSKVESKEEKLKIVCSLWNSGVQNITKISEITKISKTYVIKLLKLGKENDLCNYYNGNKTSKKKVLCIEKNKYTIQSPM